VNRTCDDTKLAITHVVRNYL